MAIINDKVLQFSFYHADQIDQLYLTFPNSQDIKNAFDSRCFDIQVKYNALIDNLLSQMLDSGASNIGVFPILGVTGNNVQSVLQNLKLLIDNAVTGNIPDGSLPGTKLQPNTITSSQIALPGISTANLQDFLITRLKILDGEVTNSKLQDFVGVGTGISTSKLQDNSITEPKMNNLSISTRTVQNGAIIQEKLAAMSVGTNELINNSVLEGKLADSSVSTRTIQDGSVTSSKLSPNAINLDVLNKSTANSEAFLDSVNEGVLTYKIYDYFDNTNNFSSGKVQTFLTYTTNAYNIGVDTINVLTTTNLVAGMEITLSGEDLAIVNQINKENLIILTILSPTSIKFATGITKSYKIQALVYRSNFTSRSPADAGISFPIYQRTGSGFGTKLVNPSGLIGGVNALTYSPSGKWIVTAISNAPFFQVIPFNETTGTMLPPIIQTVTLPIGTTTANGIAFSQDGLYLAIGYNGTFNVNEPYPYFAIFPFDDTTGKLLNIVINTASMIRSKPNKFEFNNTNDFIALSGDGLVNYRSIMCLSYIASTGVFPSPYNDFSGTLSYQGVTTQAILSANNEYILVSYDGNPSLNCFRIDQGARTLVGRTDYRSSFNNANGRACTITPDNNIVGYCYLKNPSGPDNFALYNFNNSTGIFGSKLTIPSYVGTDGKAIKATYDNKMIVVGTSTTPFVALYGIDTVTGTVTALLPPSVLPTNQTLDIAFDPQKKYAALGGIGTEVINVYNFLSTNAVQLNNTDIRYKIDTIATIKTLVIFVIATNDPLFNINCYASIQTTTTESYVLMTKTTTVMNSDLQEIKFSITTASPGQYVNFRLNEITTSLNKNYIIKILGYVE